MADSESTKKWSRFDQDIKDLAADLKRHYRGSTAEEGAAEVSRSLEQLRQAAGSVIKSIETATRDPKVRTVSKRAAHSFGAALAQTFRDLADEVDRAVSRPGRTK